MRRLTDEERIALVPIGPPGEGPVSQATFDELERLGWGKWVVGPSLLDCLLRRKFWAPTTEGLRALELDTIARTAH
jgi:hypothetical protein